MASCSIFGILVVGRFWDKTEANGGKLELQCRTVQSEV